MQLRVGRAGKADDGEPADRPEQRRDRWLAHGRAGQHDARGEDQHPGGVDPAARARGYRTDREQRGEAGGQRVVSGQRARGTVAVHRVQSTPSGGARK